MQNPAPKLPQLGADGRILEGIVTTFNEDATVNISPMGPIVDEPITQLVFRPYRTSTTYQNLKRTGKGVFHVTDDVELFAQAALGEPAPLPSLDGLILTDACRWYDFETVSLDDSQERTQIVAKTRNSGRHREFLGFNRAKHAVLEAAILATRIDMLPTEEVRIEIERLWIPVEKTGGAVEIRTFRFLQEYVDSRIASLKLEIST